MADRLFQRAARVIVGGLLLEGFRIQFRVKKTTSKEPNSCELSIYNLSEQSRAPLQAKGTRLIVEAGYAGSMAQIFSGESRLIDHAHQGPDWITKVECGDGEVAYRYARVSESFKPGTSVADVFSRVAAATGLDVADAVRTVKGAITEQFTQGFTATGKASTEVDRLLRGRGLEWSIQDNRLQVLPVGQPGRSQAVLLSSSTGLIGSPVHGTPDEGAVAGAPKPPKKNVLKVKSLLQPAIIPGGIVRIDAEATKGDFRVQQVTHVGDTFGADWYSECECVPFN